jgi:UDP-galactopyranose mutase
MIPQIHQTQPDLICLSHLRWNFVFQRPQHLMSRFAAAGTRVFFVEEPVFDSTEPRLLTSICPRTQVCVVTPHLSTDQERNQVLERLLTEFIKAQNIRKPLLWFYTPMALEFFPQNIDTSGIMYDCMDELSMFRGAPSRLQILEKYLLKKADLVFTGGVSLFEAKRHLHPRVYPFPSGVDLPHFAQARKLASNFGELESMPRPRLGYAGVIDERLDLGLIDEMASKRPTWQIVMIGPTAKISQENLPRRTNIHWLGMKDYMDLPKYFAGWDVGIMPFALNDATRFISPTKTPEYLSSGLPVVSTAIRDVERPYGELGLATIAHSVDEFIAHSERAMSAGMCLKWRQRADEFLKSMSWDSVWGGMNLLIDGILSEVPAERPAGKGAPGRSFESSPNQEWPARV